MGIKGALILAAGIGIGAIIGKVYFENKYRKIADEEIGSIKDEYCREEKEVIVVDVTEEPTPKKEEEKPVYKTEPKRAKRDEIHISIDPNQIVSYSYGRVDYMGKSYDLIEYKWYKDFVLAHEDEVVDDYDLTVGRNFRSHFGDFEEDSAYILNKDSEVIYCIIKVQERFYGK